MHLRSHFRRLLYKGGCGVHRKDVDGEQRSGEGATERGEGKREKQPIETGSVCEKNQSAAFPSHLQSAGV